MHALTAAYGYASDMELIGEGFSLSDATTGEAWYMELIGKGGFGKGALWVALRVPEGHIMVHANQARITRFLPCADEKACLMAPDVVSFAIARGYFHGEADDPSFSSSPLPPPPPEQSPSSSPSSTPSAAPSSSRSVAPSSVPSASPSATSTSLPSSSPSAVPTSLPSTSPSAFLVAEAARLRRQRLHD